MTNGTGSQPLLRTHKLFQKNKPFQKNWRSKNWRSRSALGFLKALKRSRSRSVGPHLSETGKRRIVLTQAQRRVAQCIDAVHPRHGQVRLDPEAAGAVRLHPEPSPGGRRLHTRTSGDFPCRNEAAADRCLVRLMFSTSRPVMTVT